MRTLLATLTVLSTVAMATASFAAQDVTGVVKSFNLKKMSLTLADGTKYALPAKFSNPGLKAGEKVQISFAKTGKVNEATSVTILQ